MPLLHIFFSFLLSYRANAKEIILSDRNSPCFRVSLSSFVIFIPSYFSSTLFLLSLGSVSIFFSSSVLLLSFVCPVGLSFGVLSSVLSSALLFLFPCGLLLVGVTSLSNDFLFLLSLL